MNIINATVIFGLLWFRLSDHILPLVGPYEKEEVSFVISNGFMPNKCEYDGLEMPVDEKLIVSMYYMLTTLSTVGFGDFSPVSINEKIVGSIIMILGVTIFSIVMDEFVGIVMSIVADSSNSDEDELIRWFSLLRCIKNGEDNFGTKDISEGLKNDIERHFRHFWENNRNAVF
jgi:hypothetical protein